MIIKKTPEEIISISKGAELWKTMKKEIFNFLRPGISGLDIEKKCLELFNQHKVKSAFKINNFTSELCVSVNECIVHGVPNSKILNDGDKVTIDFGFVYESMNIDSAFTTIIGKANPEYEKFINYVYRALWAGIKVIKPFCNISTITHAIENFHKNIMIPECGYSSIIDNFTGHGIGKSLHEDPQIFNKNFPPNKEAILEPNTIICIEPIIFQQTTGKYIVGLNKFDILALAPDTFSAHWEYMVLITEEGYKVLTATEEEIIKYGR